MAEVGEERCSLRNNCTRWCRRFIEAIPLPLAVVDATGHIGFFNRAAAELGGPGLREGSSLQEFSRRFRVRRADGTPLSWEELPVYRSLKHGEIVTGELLVGTTAEGEDIPAMTLAAPVRSTEGEIIGAVTAVEDLRPARELQRAREEFTAMVSHDLKNLLSGIVISADLLRREKTGPLNETQEKAVRLITSAAGKMRELLGKFLDISRMETGRFEVEADLADMGDLVREVAEGVAERLQEKRVRLELRLSSLPEAMFDRERISQVLLNLLDNALKFSPPDAAVEVAVRQVGHEGRVSVRDSGPGIPADELPHIFDRFYQARKARQVGTGLGLAICRAIVEAHGGRIWAESGPGRGSTFTFSLLLPPPL